MMSLDSYHKTNTFLEIVATFYYEKIEYCTNKYFFNYIRYIFVSIDFPGSIYFNLIIFELQEKKSIFDFFSCLGIQLYIVLFG